MALTQEQLTQRIEFCHAMVREVEGMILEGFQNPKTAKEHKADGSWVTEIDRRVEEVLRAMLEREYPGEKIIGEEFGTTEGPDELCWYLDPIDGTQSFVSGVPLFGSLIGIVENGETTLGYVRFPGLDETVYATKGGGTHWKRSNSQTFEEANVSETASLDKALFTTTSIDGFVKNNQMELFHTITREFGTNRGWTDCYAHILVATGRAEASADCACQDWDSVPFEVILKEAGGRFMDIKGNETPTGKSMVSVNGALAEEFRQILLKHT